MEGKSRFAAAVLGLFTVFVLVCGTWFLARTSSPETINVNTADAYDLQRLPGIGEKRAQDIIAWREEHGPFQTLEELTEVSGIGPVILENLRAYAAVGNE